MQKKMFSLKLAMFLTISWPYLIEKTMALPPLTVKADNVMLQSKIVSAKLIWTGVLKTGVTHYEAELICREKGMQLPTARQLAQRSQDLGAKGISETKIKGYSLVEVLDAEGNSDDFYFNNAGYKRPLNELGYYWFWSSSFRPDNSFSAYILNGNDGGLYYGDLNNEFNYIAVRCVTFI